MELVGAPLLHSFTWSHERRLDREHEHHNFRGTISACSISQKNRRLLCMTACGCVSCTAQSVCVCVCCLLGVRCVCVCLFCVRGIARGLTALVSASTPSRRERPLSISHNRNEQKDRHGTGRQARNTSKRRKYVPNYAQEHATTLYLAVLSLRRRFDLSIKQGSAATPTARRPWRACDPGNQCHRQPQSAKYKIENSGFSETGFSTNGTPGRSGPPDT